MVLEKGDKIKFTNANFIAPEFVGMIGVVDSFGWGEEKNEVRIKCKGYYIFLSPDEAEFGLGFEKVYKEAGVNGKFIQS